MSSLRINTNSNTILDELEQAKTSDLTTVIENRKEL